MAINILVRGKFSKRAVIPPTLQDVRLVENLRVRKVRKKEFSNFQNIVIAKPWGAEYLCGRNKNLEIWELYINSKSSTSLHCHPEKDTLNLVLEGQVILETLGKKQILKAGDFRVLKAGTVHRTMNRNTKSHVRVLEIESPPNKYNLIRVQDIYGREATGYLPLKLKKLSQNQVMTRYCLQSKHIKGYRLFEFMGKPRIKRISSFIRVYELTLRSITLKEDKRELLNQIQLRLAKNLILMEGSLVISRRKSIVMFLPGNCICDVPLWEFNWSATEAKALIW